LCCIYKSLARAQEPQVGDEGDARVLELLPTFKFFFKEIIKLIVNWN
jgi:hypothetical protein